MNHTLCDKHFFGVRGDRLGVGYRLSAFPADIHYWNREAGSEDRERLLGFLNGRELVAGEEWSFSLPDGVVDGLSSNMMLKMRTREGFLDFLFHGYEVYETVSGFGLLSIQVQVIKESVQVKRIFRGCRKEFGPYTKYTVAYKVRIWLKNPVRDLTDKELESPFYYDLLDFRSEEGMSFARAFKAVLMRPGQLLCNKERCFIMKLPRDLESAEVIFREEFMNARKLELESLALLGKDFAPSSEDRVALEETVPRTYFYCYGGDMFTWDSLCSPNPRHRAFVRMRLPLLEKGPHLFVKNCRRGLEVMQLCVDRWIQAGVADSVSCKFGCFEFQTYANESLKKQGGVNIDAGTVLRDTMDFCEMMIKFLKAAVNFVESLGGGDRHGAPLTESLTKLVLNAVRLDPVAYSSHENAAVARLAAFYVNGEY